MSSHSKSLLFLMQRCVAVRQATLSTGIKIRGGTLSGSGGFIQQRTWASTARTVCLQRACQLQSALKSSQYSFCTKTGAPYDDEYPPLPAYNPDSEPEKKEVYIVQVRGLPWSCSAEDLLQFFSECRIRDGVKGIHLTVNEQGRPSGRAFIEMEHEEDVNKALEKHRQYLGPRYVEVFEVTDNDAEDILKKVVRTPADDGVVRLRGLPFICTEADIVHFFSGLEIVENGITMVTDYRGRNTGEAFVQFSSQEAADEALQRDREVIGNRYIEVFPSGSDEIHSRRTRSAPPQTGFHSVNRRTPYQSNVTAGLPKSYTLDLYHHSSHEDTVNCGSLQSSTLPSHYIHMRGLPFRATGEDIVKFFIPLGVSKILIECGPDGRQTGEADVFFRCHQDAAAAMSRDRQHIGGRYIELFLNSVPEYGGR